MVSVYIDPQILALRELHAELIARDYSDTSIRERLMSQANAILDGHRAGNSAAVFHLGSWCPDFAGTDSEHMMGSSLSLEQAQDTIAKEHGYKDWNTVDALQDAMLDVAFEKTVDLVIHGEVQQLRNQLRLKPELIKQTSQYAHQSTLLHYIGANGVESYRQITPLNAAEITRCLIDAGANVNAGAQMYGGGTTALNLVMTSAHPYNAGVAADIADVLRNAGAT